MRRLILAALLAGAGCAQPGLPPGGPEDTAAPKIVRIAPDSNRTNAKVDGIRFDFDEVVSERPTGPADLAKLFLISPSWGENRVSWRRKTVTVEPRGGLKPGTTYTVHMLPGLTDLEGNSDSTGVIVTFSTGPSIARGHLRGIIFDWATQKTATKAMVEAFALPTGRDSTRYIALADSSGRFDLANVPAGRYLLRAVIDANTNRLLDPRELYDSATVTLQDSLRREMLAIVRDTLGPGIQTITYVDSLTLRIQLDHLLDPKVPITDTSFAVLRADSTRVPIARVLTAKAFEEEKARADSLKAKSTADSVAAAAAAKGEPAKVDSAALRRARADSASRNRTARPDSVKDSLAVAPPPPRSRLIPPSRPRRGEAPTAVSTQAPKDTVKKDSLPKPSVEPPINEVVLRLGEPLEAGKSYRVRTNNLRSYLGFTRSAQRSINTPKPKPSDKDSMAADSGRTRGRGADSPRLRPRGPDTLRRPIRRDTLKRDTIGAGGTPVPPTHIGYTPPWIRHRER